MWNKKQKLTRLEDIPQSSVGAPIPFVVAAEHHLDVLYYTEQSDPDWDRTSVRVVGQDSVGETVALARFHRPYAHQFGPPNDEAIRGHPLFHLGLEPYSSFEITASKWIDELCKRNSVHPYHKDSHFADYRHFILTFHDSTFEAIAERYEAKIIGKMSVLEAASKCLAEWRDD